MSRVEWAVNRHHLAAPPHGHASGGLLTLLNSFAGGDAEQIGDPPDDVVLHLAALAIGIDDVPEDADEFQPLLGIEMALQVGREADNSRRRCFRLPGRLRSLRPAAFRRDDIDPSAVCGAVSFRCLLILPSASITCMQSAATAMRGSSGSKPFLGLSAVRLWKKCLKTFEHADVVPFRKGGAGSWVPVPPPVLRTPGSSGIPWKGCRFWLLM